jgi:hypothetical protein
MERKKPDRLYGCLRAANKGKERDMSGMNGSGKANVELWRMSVAQKWDGMKSRLQPLGGRFILAEVNAMMG